MRLPDLEHYESGRHVVETDLIECFDFLLSVDFTKDPEGTTAQFVEFINGGEYRCTRIRRPSQ